MPTDAGDVVLNRSSTAKARSPQTLWAEQRPGEAGLTIAGAIAADAMSATLTVAVGNPTLWFARFVRARLIAAGIGVEGPAVDVDDLAAPPARAEMLLSHRSRALADIVQAMLKNSINMYAEAILWLATGPAGPRTTAEAIAAERRQLRAWGVAEGAVQIADGSGLSRFDVIAPEALLTVLQQFFAQGAASPFIQALPIAGVDGTLAERMKGTPAAGNARAKTGSMTNVRSLTGYVTTADGEPLAFAILANNFEAGGAAVTATIDRIVVRLASFSRRR
jgi:D-alanyl-D-alanine carboxypeptidase/D-alanyl-D-alanine-endopeptidase (penicillin-binding protein 4)